MQRNMQTSVTAPVIQGALTPAQRTDLWGHFQVYFPLVAPTNEEQRQIAPAYDVSYKTIWREWHRWQQAQAMPPAVAPEEAPEEPLTPREAAAQRLAFEIIEPLCDPQFLASETLLHMRELFEVQRDNFAERLFTEANNPWMTETTRVFDLLVRLFRQVEAARKS